MPFAVRVLSRGLTATTVGLQIAYPLLHGRSRDRLSAAIVLSFSGATLTDEAVVNPRNALRLLGIAGGGSLALEALGVRTGVPFGRYRYGERLGPKLVGVPVLVPLAWVMMSGPALAAGRRLARGRFATIAASSVALASWDLFLDPQMVGDGHWTWTGKGPALLGIPLRNYAGWLAASTVLMTVLDRALPRRDDDAALNDAALNDAVPMLLFAWTYAGSVLANAVFLRRPEVAVTGGLGMGTIALPLAARWWRERRR